MEGIRFESGRKSRMEMVERAITGHCYLYRLNRLSHSPTHGPQRISPASKTRYQPPPVLASAAALSFLLGSSGTWLMIGGSIHLAISNRCFATKVVSIWLRLNEIERLELISNYLHFSGFEDIEVVDLVKGGVVGR